MQDTVRYLQAEAEANWIKTNQPEIWKKTDKYVFLSGFLTYKLIGKVIDSVGCHSGHVVGQKLIFDNSGNLLTKENPDRVCAFLMPNMTVLINAFFENLMNGRDPNEVMFNTTACFDTGPHCGGWGHVKVRMTAELKS